MPGFGGRARACEVCVIARVASRAGLAPHWLLGSSIRLFSRFPVPWLFALAACPGDICRCLRGGDGPEEDEEKGHGNGGRGAHYRSTRGANSLDTIWSRFQFQNGLPLNKVVKKICA